MPEALGDDDFPALYVCADKASLRAQVSFLFWFRAALGLAVFVAASIWAADRLAGCFHVDYIIVIAAILTLVPTFVLQNKGYDDIWYKGRAIAESVKSISWIFMMRALPYEGQDQIARQELLSEIHSIEMQKSVKLRGVTAGSAAAGSAKLMEVRRLNVAERLEFYLRFRLRDQKTWYTKKAIECESSEGTFYALALTLQIASIGIAVFCLVAGHFLRGTLPIIETMSASVFAWLQVKKYSDNADAYRVAADELGYADASAGQVTNDAELAAFVANTESAISREHTLWRARRVISTT